MGKNKSLLFSCTASILIIAFMFIVNYMTSWSHPWFIYPTFAVIWWPMSVYFAENKNWKMYAVSASILVSIFFLLVNFITSPGFLWAAFPIFAVIWWPLSMIICGAKKYKLFSIIGSLLIIAFFFAINMITSPSIIWFIYPLFAIIWWPLSMIICGAKKYKLFSVVGSLLIIALFFAINMITSPSVIWFIYPLFAIIWWPLSMIICGAKKYKLFSVIGSLLIIAFFFTINMITSPSVIWFIYPLFAIIWWPLSMIICGAKKYKLFSIVASSYIVAFLALVNLITSPQYMWFYYPAYALIWWPISMFVANKISAKLYSIIMSVITLAFLVIINLQNSPDVLWFQWAIFYLIWWPMVMLLGQRAKTLTFSIISAIVIIAYFILQYYILTPGEHPWYLYIILPVIWWPVSIAFKNKRHTKLFLFTSLVIFTLYYGALNLFLYPEYPWILHMLYPFAWVVISDYFGSRKKYFSLSIAGTLITIAYFSIVNYITTPNTIWAVYPVFAVLWWPLSYYFFKVRKKKNIQA